MAANLNNLRSLNRVCQVPNSRFCKNFAACLLNAQSVCNKTLVIKDFVVDHAVDLLGITETWLHQKGDDVIIGELCPNGYRFVHTPRLAGTGGGVGLLYKQGICTKTRICQHSGSTLRHEYVSTLAVPDGLSLDSLEEALNPLIDELDVYEKVQLEKRYVSKNVPLIDMMEAMRSVGARILISWSKEEIGKSGWTTGEEMLTTF